MSKSPDYIIYVFFNYKINEVQLHMMFESYGTYVLNKLYINLFIISLDVLPKVRIIVMFNFLKYSTHPAVLEVLTRVCTLGQTFHIIYMYLEYSNNLKRLFDSLCAITGESSFISMLFFTFERFYKTLKHVKTYLIMSIHQVTGRECRYSKLKHLRSLSDKMAATNMCLSTPSNAGHLFVS